MIDFNAQLNSQYPNEDYIPKVYESAELQDNLEHSGGITISWNSDGSKVIPLGAYVKYPLPEEGQTELDAGTVRYILLEPYAPTRQGNEHWRYSPTFSHPVSMLDRVPFWIKGKDAEVNDVLLRTTTFTGYAHTIAQKLADFFADYATETGDNFFRDTFGTWNTNLVESADGETKTLANTVITVNFDGCSFKSAAQSVANAIGCNVFFDWNSHTVRFVCGTSIDGESYNCFHVLGGTKNMSKYTANGSYAALTQRLTIPAGTYKREKSTGDISKVAAGETVDTELYDKYTVTSGGIIDMSENGGLRLTTDLVFDNIYPKMELYIKSARERLCYLTDENGKKIEESTGVYKLYSKWYVKLTADKHDTVQEYLAAPDFAFEQNMLINDKTPALLFQPDYTNQAVTSALAGREFDVVPFTEENPGSEWQKDDVIEREHPFHPRQNEFRIDFSADGDIILPSTSGINVENYIEAVHDNNNEVPVNTDYTGLYPHIGNKVTLVNVAAVNRSSAEMELLSAAIETIRLMKANEADYTGDVIENVPAVGKEYTLDRHKGVVNNVTMNLDTGVASVTVGAWKRSSLTQSLRDNIDYVKSDGEWYDSGDRGLSAAELHAVYQTMTKLGTAFTSYMFVRLNSQPTKPAASAGSYDDPSPQNQYADDNHTVAWTDGIPNNSSAKLWMTRRIFTSDGLTPQQDSWSDPVPMSDSDTLDVEFALMQAGDAKPHDPDATNRHKEAYEYGYNGQIWFDPDLDKYSGVDAQTGAKIARDFTQMYWMSMRECKNGEWGSWVVVRVKGEQGAPAGNTATVYLYKRFGTIPDWQPNTWKPTATLYYDFARKKLYTAETGNTEASSQLNGWSLSIPSGTGKLYVTAAIAYSTTERDGIDSGEWVTPVQFTGEDGAQGADGAPGINSATIFIYKRALSIAANDMPVPLYYKFFDGQLYKKLPNGNYVAPDATSDMNLWTTNIPSNTIYEKLPCWVRQVAALGNGEYDEVSEWGEPTKLVEDGKDGTSVEIKGSLDFAYRDEITAASDNLNKLMVKQGDAKLYKCEYYQLAGGYQWVNRKTAVNGDCYIVKQGNLEGGSDSENVLANHLITWSSDANNGSGAWVDLGQFKGDDGENGETTAALYKWSLTSITAPTVLASNYMSGTNLQGWSKAAVERTNEQEGYSLWMTQNTIRKVGSSYSFVNNAAWSIPVRISGADGTPGEDAKEREWIYISKVVVTTFSGNSHPMNITTGTANGQTISGNARFTTDDFVPTGWSDNALPVNDSTSKYVYASWRDWDKSNQRWGDFNDPILWSNWGHQGIDGDGIEYVFVRTQAYESQPSVPTQEQSPTYCEENNNYTVDGHLPYVRIGSSVPISGSTTPIIPPTPDGYKYVKCTNNPVGADPTWKYEWVLVRSKGSADSSGARQWNAYSGPMALWSKWSTDGSSPWIADLDNEMDSVSCDQSCHPVVQQTVITNVNLYYGAAKQAIDSVSVKRNGVQITAQQMDANINGVSVNVSDKSGDTDTKVIRITYDTTALLTGLSGSGRDVYEITLSNTASGIERAVNFTVKGVVGDVYNVLPQDEKIVATIDDSGHYVVGNSSSYQMTCGYTKNTFSVADGINRIKVDSVTDGVVDNRYFLYGRRRSRASGYWECYDATKPQGQQYNLNNDGVPFYSLFSTKDGKPSSFQYDHTILDLNTFDAIELVITSNGSDTTEYIYGNINILDREIIYVISNGRDGQDGQDGRDGMSIEIKGTVDYAYKGQYPPSTTTVGKLMMDTDYPRIYRGITNNWEVLVAVVPDGDCYIVKEGNLNASYQGANVLANHLIQWSAAANGGNGAWIDHGQFLGDDGRNGIDGNGMEYVFVRTKENQKPSVATGTTYGESATGDDPYTNDGHLPYVRINRNYNIIGYGNDEGTVDGNYKYVKCTNNPVGVDSDWQYEWVLMRTKGTANSSGTRQWQKYSGNMSLWTKWGKNSVRIDLDNQADLVSVDSNGLVRFDRNVTVNVQIYDGSTPVTSGVSNQYEGHETLLKIGTCTPQVSFYNGQLTVTWHFTKGTAVSPTPVSIILTYGGVAYTATFKLGTTASEAIYQLLPSRNSLNFIRQSDGSLSPSSIQIWCGYVKHTGSGSESHPLQYNITSEDSFNFDNSGYALWVRHLKADGTPNTWTDSQGVTVSPDGWIYMTAIDNHERDILSSTSLSAVQFCIGPANGNRYQWSDSDIIDIETLPIVKDGEHGESPWTADMDNEVDSISCDDMGYPVAVQTVETKVSLYHGNAAAAFTIDGIKRNGSKMTWVSNKWTDTGVEVTYDSTYKKVSVKYWTSTAINGKDDFTITLQAANATSITRELHFIVNGIYGDVYNLRPGVSEIVATRDINDNYQVNGSSSFTLSCGCVKRVNGLETAVNPSTAGKVDSKYYIYRRLRNRTSQAWDNYAVFSSSNRSMELNTYDAVEFVLFSSNSTASNVIDRETVYVVANGKDGNNGTPSVYLKSHDTYWKLSTSGTTAPTANWSATRKTPTAEKKYCWRKDVWTYDAAEYGRNMIVGSADLKENNNQTWGAGYVWKGNNKGTLEIDTSHDLPLTALVSCVKMKSNSLSSNEAFNILYAGYYELTYRKKITVSCYIQGPIGTHVRINAAYNTSAGNNDNVSAGSRTFELATNEWARYEVTGTVGTTTNMDNTKWMIGLIDLLTSNTTIYVAGIKVEYGDRATDWCKAPEDFSREEVSVWSVYGDTPNVQIINGNWYINGSDTHVQAEGKDGTGVEIKGSVQKYSTTSGYTSLQSLTGMVKGDCYIVDDTRHLYIYLASGSWPNNWKDLGEFKGKDGESRYMHIAYATEIVFSGNSVFSVKGFTVSSEQNSTNYPWIGYRVDGNEQDPGAGAPPTSVVDARKYKWSYQRGMDGDTYEYVYIRTKKNIAPTINEDDEDTSGLTSEDDEYLPAVKNGATCEAQPITIYDGGWVDIYQFTDNPMGVIKAYPYEWESVRKKTNGVWGAFSDPATLRSTYSESPWTAVLDNEVDSVACDSSGNVVGLSQTAKTVISLYYGGVKKNFKVEKIIRAYGSGTRDYNSNGTYNSVQVSLSPDFGTASDSKTLTVTYNPNSSNANAIITGKDTFTIRVKADEDASIVRDVVFTVNGMKGGVLYSLVPSVTTVNKLNDNTYSPQTVSCQYRKYDVNLGAYINPSGASISYLVDGTSGSVTPYGSALRAGTAFSKNVTFLLTVDNTVVDRQTVNIVSDGKDGDDGDQPIIQLLGELANTWYENGILNNNSTQNLYLNQDLGEGHYQPSDICFYYKSDGTPVLNVGGTINNNEQNKDVAIRLFEKIGTQTITINKRLPNSGDIYDIALVDSSFTDPFTNMSITGNKGIWVYVGGSWVQVRDNTTAVMKNYGNAIVNAVFGSDYSGQRNYASEMLTIKNAVRLLTQITENGKTLAQAMLALGVSMKYYAGSSQDDNDLLIYDSSKQEWHYVNGNQVYTGEVQCVADSEAELNADVIKMVGKSILFSNNTGVINKAEVKIGTEPKSTSFGWENSAQIFLTGYVNKKPIDYVKFALVPNIHSSSDIVYNLIAQILGVLETNGIEVKDDAEVGGDLTVSGNMKVISQQHELEGKSATIVVGGKQYVFTKGILTQIINTTNS